MLHLRHGDLRDSARTMTPFRSWARRCNICAVRLRNRCGFLSGCTSAPQELRADGGGATTSRNTRTGLEQVSTSRIATLPAKTRPRAPRSRCPTTTRATSNSAAMAASASAGLPRTTRVRAPRSSSASARSAASAVESSCSLTAWSPALPSANGRFGQGSGSTFTRSSCARCALASCAARRAARRDAGLPLKPTRNRVINCVPPPMGCKSNIAARHAPRLWTMSKRRLARRHRSARTAVSA